MDKGLRLVRALLPPSSSATAGRVGLGRMETRMTKDKRAKRDARDRQQATGERYTAARRNTTAQDVQQTLLERHFEPDHCANCLEQLYEGVEGLFCSELCSQTAETVRYFRRIARNARAHDPDVKLAMQTMMAHLLAGRYHKQARHLAREVINQVWDRDHGLCVECAKDGAEIDHIDGDSPDLTNLQLLCQDCHHAKTAGRMVPATEEQMKWIHRLRSQRVDPEVPALLCDDQDEWRTQGRTLKKERRTRLLHELSFEYGQERSDFPGMSWREMWDDVLDEDDNEGGWTEDDDSGFGPYSYFAHAMAKDD